jgi:putative DNA primase/helicase
MNPETEVQATVERYMAEFLEFLDMDLKEGALQHAARNFALVYAGGRLAIEAGLLPWREERLRSAIKTCFKAGLRSITKPENVTSKARRILRAMLKEKEFPTYRQGRGAPDPKADGFKVREDGTHVYKIRSQFFVRQFPSKAHAVAALTWLDQKGALRKASPARDVQSYEWAVTSPRWPEARKFKAVVFVDPFSR